MGNDYVFNIRIVYVVPVRPGMVDNNYRCSHYFGFLLALVESEMKKEEKMEAEYAKTEFVGIKSVTKEIYQGNTYYVVVTESGEIFGVDARKYPEISTANEQNKVKYVIDDYKVNGLQKPFKLELK